MSAELINLRNARKNKLRAEADKIAEENRVKFGRTKTEKKITTRKNARFTKEFDGHKREP